MRRWLIVLLILVGMLGLAGFVLWRLPRLREVSPAPGTIRVSEGAVLQLTFSRRMQTASVASHLHLDPPKQGKYSWDDNTLTFTPDTPWPSGITVTVQLKAGAAASGFPPLPSTASKSWSFGITKPMLAYLWPANLPADIYALDPVSGETLRLTEGANVQDFSVSADGADLFFSAITQTTQADIYQLNWRDDITSLILACPGANCHNVQISPGGDFLAYERTPVNDPEGPEFPQVWLLPLPNGTPYLVDDPTHETIQPDWSPDGKLAYYDRAIQAFILLDPRSQESHTFLNQTGETGCWTADGKAYVAPEISFVPLNNTTEVPASRLMRYDWTTSQVTDLTGGEDLEDSSPAFSPDGRRMAFARRSLNPALWTIGRQLWLSDPDGKNAHPLLDADPAALDSFSNYDFAWKPDSSQLAYVRSNQDYPLDPPELWLVDANGLNRLQLVVGGYAPQWVR